MAAEQSMTQAIRQATIKATKVAIMAVREAKTLISSARPIQATPIWVVKL